MIGDGFVNSINKNELNIISLESEREQLIDKISFFLFFMLGSPCFFGLLICYFFEFDFIVRILLISFVIFEVYFASQFVKCDKRFELIIEKLKELEKSEKELLVKKK